ncbi:velvet factor-domain-containing protein [Gilbertella persicaria]|uniref:Velvet domain-containing protein n=1 Tax=Rhizopus stolonifer TaxID=4846 RepID=A0A367J698_RHIST|nr:velvet factor-domain-containing protein [Gilbertella persicaria]KAI8052586.1 velvet factor-domain-containing protein [Gilbertella persicaria]RCH85436.1 hypothetical protein CU098_005939 [Rhizopus stolonifer]
MSSTNSPGGCTYRFIESSLSSSSDQILYDIEIRQQPQRAKVSLINERDRRPIEPPPILQLHWQNCSEEELKKRLQSPFYFTVANLVTVQDPETPLLPAQEYLSGTTVSSLYRLRDIDNSDGGFFVFGDLAVKKEGKFKLRFSLFEIVDGQVKNRRTILSNTFTVHIPKQFPGPIEATFLSRTFSDQGVKMRIRKEHRLQSRKRKPESTVTDTSVNNNSNNNNVAITKKYRSKHMKMIVSSESSDANGTSDVFFGRWQATSRITPPPTQTHQYMTEEDMKNKHRYQQAESHAQAFPSPESTIYNTMSTCSSSSPTPRSMTYQRESPYLYRPVPMHYSSPPMAESPLSSSIPLPSDPSLAKYHMCSDSHHSRMEQLPSPPSCITDMHRTQDWGTRLPPLRAIMNGSSSLFPLLLPPPSTMVRIEQPVSYAQRPHYYC